MTLLSELLDKKYKTDEALTSTEQQQLWNEVSGYISKLERRVFKTNKKQQYEAHTERILALHDFIRLYSLPRGKTIEWALAVFSRRFADVETTLTIRRRMNVEIPGAETGFRSIFVIFLRQYFTAKRACKEASIQCVEDAYFKNKRFAGKRARAHFKKQVEHHFELVNRTIVALSWEALTKEERLYATELSDDQQSN